MFDRLFHFGGFPEPFFKQDDKTLRRWQNERVDRLIREDIRDIELIRDLSRLEILVGMLPEKVGSLLSLNSMREDIGVTHVTLSRWMDMLERFYYHFRLRPFAATHIKSLRKEPKLYLWDWSEAPSKAARFENMVASHLLKFAHFLHDAEGYKIDVFFLRDIEGREADFLVTHDRTPWFAVEVKQSDTAPSKQLRYFVEKLSIPFAYQVVAEHGIDFTKDGVRVMSGDVFLGGLV